MMIQQTNQTALLVPDAGGYTLRVAGASFWYATRESATEYAASAGYVLAERRTLASGTVVITRDFRRAETR